MSNESERAWEAVYESATFTPRLIADRPTEATARAAAEAWLREHSTVSTDLEWVPDPQMCGNDWADWQTLTYRGQGVRIDTEVVVRRRAALDNAPAAHPRPCPHRERMTS